MNPALDLQAFPFGSASALAAALRRGRVSSVDLLQAYLERVDRLNPALNALVVFGRHDLLLMPITATAAFEHDHSEPMPARRMTVNGRPVPYFAQLFWAGLATASYLPSTVAPVGLTPEGLPVGMQIVGPEMADRSTIWLAGQLARLIGGYTPPPGC